MWKKLVRPAAAFGRLIRSDPSTRMAVAIRCLQVLSSPINSLLLVLCMTVEQQGIYYLFMGLLAVRIVFELGAATAIGQLTTHSLPEGQTEIHRSFVVAVNRWMLQAALLMLLLAGTGGAVFLYVQDHGDPASIVAWLLLVGGSACGLSTEGRLSILYGSGQVPFFFKLRLISGTILIVGNWLMLAAGFGLFSFGVAVGVSLSVGEFLLWRQHRSLYALRRRGDQTKVAEHTRSIKKLLSRVSCVSLPVYLSGNMQAVIGLHCLGASSLALIGFVTSIGTSAIGFSSILLHTALPQLTALAARSDVHGAGKFFRKRFGMTLVAIAAGVAASVLAVAILSTYPRFAQRLPDWRVSLLVFAGLSLQNIMGALVLWPRAFLLEPFSIIGLGQIVLMPLLMYYSAQHFGLPGLAAAGLVTWALGVLGVFLKWPRIPHVTGTPGFA